MVMMDDDDVFDLDAEEYADVDDDFVPAIFAHSSLEVSACIEILANHDIQTIVGDERDLERDEMEHIAWSAGMTHGIPVLVPEALLDESGSILAGRDDIDGFADLLKNIFKDDGEYIGEEDNEPDHNHSGGYDVLDDDEYDEDFEDIGLNGADLFDED